MTDTAGHGALMDEVYRYQRRVYDLTRKYYLLGRDHLIGNMQVAPGQSVLEIACGTGRNLAAIGRRYPGAELHGLDISEQMLLSAQAKLGARARLVRADACAFDAQTLFGRTGFDHIVLSYSLSMIPDWQAAIRQARAHLAPGGQLHIVDFGDQSGLPRWFKRGLRQWLARFHVAPRDPLEGVLRRLRGETEFLQWRSLYGGYASYARWQANGS